MSRCTPCLAGFNLAAAATMSSICARAALPQPGIKLTKINMPVITKIWSLKGTLTASYICAGLIYCCAGRLQH